jgi:capsular polysaccharide biosynthesis protein
MEQRQTYNSKEEDVDLRVFLKVLNKRKKLIMTVFFIIVALSLLVSFFAPKVYEASFVIELGRIDKILISKGETRDMVLNQNFIASILKDLKLNMDVETLRKSINFKDTNSEYLLEVDLKCSDADVCLKLSDAIASRFVEQGKKIYKDSISFYVGRLAELDAAISNVQRDIKRSQDLISTLVLDKTLLSSDLTFKGILLQNTLLGHENNIIVLKNQRNDLRLFLMKTKDFNIFDSPMKPQSSMGSGKKQKVLAGALVGLLFGVLLAFFVEYWQQEKKNG